MAEEAEEVISEAEGVEEQLLALQKKSKMLMMLLVVALVAAIGSQDSVRVPGGNDRVQGGDTAIILVEEDVVDAALSFFQPGKN